MFAFLGTQDVWFLVIVGIMLSKFGKIKLGKDKEKPEFNNTAYFTMLFAAGEIFTHLSIS